MRSKKVIVTLLAVVVLALGSSLSAFAAVPAADNATSGAYVGFTAFTAWDQMSLVRPGPAPTATVAPGAKDPRAINVFTAPSQFRLAWVPTFNFGRHQITAGAVDTSIPVLCENLLYAAPVLGPVPQTPPSLVGGAAIPAGANTVAPFAGSPGDHFINVWDYRNMGGNTPNGWAVAVRMTQQFTEFTPAGEPDPVSPHVLAGAYIRLNSASLPGGRAKISGFRPESTVAANVPISVAEATAIARETGNRDIQFAVGGGPIINIARAPANEGQGSIAINLGQGENITLRLPTATVAAIRPGNYRAQLTWMMNNTHDWPTGL